MATCPGYGLDDDFVQEMFVGKLTEEQLASLRVRWEPFRAAIERRLDSYLAHEDEWSWRDYRNGSFDFLPYPTWDGFEMLWPEGPLSEESAWAWEEPPLETLHQLNARLVVACAHVWSPDARRSRWERCTRCGAVQIPGRGSTRKIWVLRRPPVAGCEA